MAGRHAATALMHWLKRIGSMQVVTERAAAVIGNLSTSRDYFSSIRESGALQKLVALLDAGSTSRVTEIAAKTLANLSIDDNSRKGIRLAGGVPPLMRLLLEKPSEQAGFACLRTCVIQSHRVLGLALGITSRRASDRGSSFLGICTTCRASCGAYDS